MFVLYPKRLSLLDRLASTLKGKHGLFKNYFKISFRNILRNKLYSSVNILGLSVGMACAILILLWVRYELSYDRFFPNADRLCRVTDTENYPGGGKTVFSMNPPSLASALVDEYPEIVNTARLRSVKDLLLQYGDERFDENNVMFVDPSFLKMFSLPFVEGNGGKALSGVSSVVVTQAMAKKYFGSADPIGRTIRVNNRYDFVVTGVIKDIPPNSHLNIHFLFPFDAIKNFGYSLTGWDSYAHTTYVLLAEGANYREVSKKIADTIERHSAESKTTISLQPIEDIHLYSSGIWGIGGTGDITRVYIFSAIAVLILLLACINFMNLSTARAGSRAKEIGVRKVVGARRKEIALQFFLESILYAFISVVLSSVLVMDLVPVVNSISGSQLTLTLHGSAWILLLISGVALFTGIISGIYPALFLSAFRPAGVLKGRFGAGISGGHFRKFLVVFQFALTIVLITATVVIDRQLHFMENKNLGFDKERVLTVKLQGDLNKRLDLIEGRMRDNRQVVGVTGVSYSPAGILSSTDVRDWQGRKSDTRFLMYVLSADYGFAKTMRIEMAKGRYFASQADTADGCVVNQAAVRAMNMKSPIGKKVLGLRIVGVMKDFNFTSLHSRIEPLLVVYDPSSIQQLLVRVKPGDVGQTLESLKETWSRVAPLFPFEYGFLNQQIDKLYGPDQRVGSLINVFSFLALFIACLGMFGLASFSAEQRTKEVGVRKVLGAKVWGIVLLLTKEFTKYVLVANLFAWPIAYFALNEWLQDYAYRIEMSWWIFAAAGAFALLVALATVSFQALRAAVLNPVEALRYE